MKKIILNLQINTDQRFFIPKKKKILYWLKTILNKRYEITIRVVDILESKKLNYIYRKENQPTNILSFQYKNIYIKNILLLGDLVICAQILEKEAYEQNKILQSHWAHMIIHGVLHLMQYHHDNKYHANIMEKLEIKIMKNLGYQNPYK